RWDLVFNIAEGVRGFGREAQVPALLDAYEIPYTFSDPLVLSLTLHKGMTKRVIRDLGLPTPDFRLVETMADVRDLDLPFPLFVKPVAEGTGKGIGAASRVSSAKQLHTACRRLLEKFHQPVLVETFLPGREFTVGILGTGKSAEAVGAMEVVLTEQAEPQAYTYKNKKRFVELVQYRPVRDRAARDAMEIALEAWRGLGCRDGGRVDLRADGDGNPAFMEVNPLAGLHPIDSDLPILCRFNGIDYRDLLEKIMDSALSRYQPPASRRKRAIGRSSGAGVGRRLPW
ncbi:MAG: D-alanine--D-alanine ligase, partial [Deltaproteobacteria bacterium]|nr:D-alanine--D-alanine ligase [Deltaproteobacteria bacterium]